MHQQKFSIDFSFPVHFTQSVFSPGNSVFLSTIRRLEPENRRRVLFVIDSNVAARQPQLVEDIHGYMTAHKTHLDLAGPPIVVPGGESSKNDLVHVIDLLEVMNMQGMDRQSVITVIGGGAVLDMGCFAAAIAHRGIRTLRLPTTVLAQCDSGVGVKNGVNIFGKKNFIGTFVPPFGVINDSDFIRSLERRDKIAGLAECVKVSLLRDPDYFEYLEQNSGLLANTNENTINRAIRRSAELHMRHIQECGDPFEFGSSRPLDFGHWAAHKLEAMTGHALRHGEAVAIGIALDVIYAVRRGFLAEPAAERIIKLLAALGFELWTNALDDLNEDGVHTVLSGIQEFREHLGGALHIAMLRDIGRPFDVHEMDEDVIVQTIEALRSRFQVAAPSATPVAALNAN